MNVLKLGIPKGSLEDATIALFDKSGWRIKLASRNYFPEVDDPELSWDATKILFTFKGEPNGSTRIFEIGVDGRGLRPLSVEEVRLVREVYLKNKHKLAVQHGTQRRSWPGIARWR